jgi:hypothetical protein
MRIYVQQTYTTAVEIDPEDYEVGSREALAEACEADQDFYEYIGHGPTECYEVEFEVVTDPDTMAALDEERPWTVNVELSR